MVFVGLGAIASHELISTLPVGLGSPRGLVGQELFLQEFVELAVGRHVLVSLQSLDVLILEGVEVRVEI